MTYVPHDADDRDYFGAARVVEAEFEHLRTRRGRGGEPDKDPAFTGIALSGGGIRSASYCLGVLQAMAKKGWLERIDYLSTVSGGGYIGSSLTWLLHKAWKLPPDAASGPGAESRNGSQRDTIRFGVDEKNFPYGTYPIVGASAGEPGFPPRYQGALLRFLRQHARYLTPGNGMNVLALAAAVLRNSLYSILFYGALIVAIFLLIGQPFLFEELCDPVSGWVGTVGGLPLQRLLANNALLLAGALGALFVLMTVGYGLFTWFTWHFSRQKTYAIRRFWDIAFGAILLVTLVLVVVGGVPLLSEWITSGESVPKKMKALWTGGGSMLSGLVAAGASYFQTTKGGKKPWISANALAIVGSVLLIVGALLLAYGISDPVKQIRIAFIPLGIFVLIGALVVGRFVNINYMSMHRYYRDRLMEVFLPDVADAVRTKGRARNIAHDADQGPLQEMCGATPAGKDDADAWTGPYHLINTNLVLVSSDVPKFRARGGDNFVLSPLWCGSNATGWTKTKWHPAYDRLSLASAMAISGAAVNPNTGSGGEGVTRERAVSLLMGLLNIRLGYWIENPMPQSVRKHNQELQGMGWPKRILYGTLGRLCGEVPNAVCPGLLDVWLRLNLDETSRMVQLSDGGHFENLGLYELVRRRLKLIIVCDGTADPEYSFDDLANALEKIRVDFGALVHFEGGQSGLEGLVPGGRAKVAERGYICGKIEYAPVAGHPGSRETGTLIYLTTTFFKQLPVDLYGYRRTHPEFPDEPTADQFFDERQFEAYRELGYKTAFAMINDHEVRNLPDVLGTVAW